MQRETPALFHFLESIIASQLCYINQIACSGLGTGLWSTGFWPNLTGCATCKSIAFDNFLATFIHSIYIVLLKTESKKRLANASPFIRENISNAKTIFYFSIRQCLAVALFVPFRKSYGLLPIHVPFLLSTACSILLLLFSSPPLL